ncbi:c-type cytochrome [Spartinivicinus poritis]
MKRAVLLVLVGMLLPGISAAAGDPAKGKAKAAVCAACHGKNGVAMVPIYPNLAGQNQAYLESSLKAYRAKQRQGGQAVVMQAQAANLSDEDIANLSAYYSNLK